MADKLGLTALLVGALASGCGGEELKPKLKQAYVFAEFQEDDYCGRGENFNGLEGNIYRYVTANNLVVHSDLGSGYCGNAEVEDLDFLYVSQFLGPV